VDQREAAHVNQLVEAARAGDEEALRQLIAWAMEFLFPNVLAMLRERHARGSYLTDVLHAGGPDLYERMQDDAWAITHAACCRMAAKLATFRGRGPLGQRVQFGTWLYAIARNEMRTLLRDRWRERRRRHVWEEASAAAPGELWAGSAVDGALGSNWPPGGGLGARWPEGWPSPDEQVAEAWERELLREALAKAPLTPEQRQAVLLFHGLGWRQERIAEVTGVQVGTVKKRIFDGLRKLRAYMQERSAEPPKAQGRMGHG